MRMKMLIKGCRERYYAQNFPLRGSPKLTCVVSLQVPDRLVENGQQWIEDFGHLHAHRVCIVALLHTAIEKLNLTPKVCHPPIGALELIA
jgi:hypothetical protein